LTCYIKYATSSQESGLFLVHYRKLPCLYDIARRQHRVTLNADDMTLIADATEQSTNYYVYNSIVA